MYEIGKMKQLLKCRCITNPLIIFFLNMNLNMVNIAFRELKDIFVFNDAYSTSVIFLTHSERKCQFGVMQITWRARSFLLGLCLTIPNDRSYLKYVQNCLKICIIERILFLTTFCRNLLLSVMIIIIKNAYLWRHFPSLPKYWHT